LITNARDGEQLSAFFCETGLSAGLLIKKEVMPKAIDLIDPVKGISAHAWVSDSSDGGEALEALEEAHLGRTRDTQGNLPRGSNFGKGAFMESR
jgi:hypothetical protein